MSAGLEFYTNIYYTMTSGCLLPAVIGNDIPEKLSSGPKSVDELCQNTNINPDRLHRFLIQLEASGIFSFNTSTKLWENNQNSAYLTDITIKSFILLHHCKLNIKSSSYLHELLCSDKNALEIQGLCSLFDQVGQDDKFLKVFQQSMQGLTAWTKDRVLDGIDLSTTNNLLDVGGGDGSLSISLLSKYPDKHFGVYERSECAEIARKNIESYGFTSKITTIEGNFLESIAGGFDGIVMKHIIHDWPDADCVKILKGCRQVLKEGDKLFIVDSVVERENQFYRWQTTFDILMMMMFASKERSRSQFEELFRQSGFRIERITEAMYDNVITAVAI